LRSGTKPRTKPPLEAGKRGGRFVALMRPKTETTGLQRGGCNGGTQWPPCRERRQAPRTRAVIQHTSCAQRLLSIFSIVMASWSQAHDVIPLGISSSWGISGGSRRVSSSRHAQGQRPFPVIFHPLFMSGHRPQAQAFQGRHLMGSCRGCSCCQPRSVSCGPRSYDCHALPREEYRPSDKVY